MKKIIITQEVFEVVELYVRKYRFYYQDLFEDTGIWNAKQIVQWYQNESIRRYSEILEVISGKLSNSIISYSDNTTLIRWRSKILLVSFVDEWDTRIITDLEIR